LQKQLRVIFRKRAAAGFAASCERRSKNPSLKRPGSPVAPE
jgi:hypothetical protein